MQARLPNVRHDPQVVRGSVEGSGEQSPDSLDPPATIWTIGHSTHTIDEFIALLREHEIEQIADVRRFPGSRRYPQFNPEELAVSLGTAGIDYVPCPALGGRRKALPDSPHSAWRNEAFRGYADYMDTEEFRAAAAALATIARRERTAIMCAEGVWWRCHRSMISDWFKVHDWTVMHIMGAGGAKEHPYTPVAKIEGGELVY